MIKSNDETFFRQVYEDVFPVIMKVTYHITYSADISEELCQEAFIRFYDKEMVFNSMEEAKFWLIRVSKNLAINYIRKKSRETAFLENTNGVFDDGDSMLSDRESVETIRSAIAQLPEMYKTVLVLREYADLSYSDIASVLHISETNVKVRIYRARKALEEVLRREDLNVFR